MSTKFLTYIFCLLLFFWATVTAQGQASKTVQVDCSKGKGINTALHAHTNAEELIIEISGFCHENLNINRDGVTLRGSDPDADGIRGVSTDIFAPPAFGSVLRIEDAFRVTVENLTITGGARHGIAVIDSRAVTVTNSRLEDNAQFGLRVARGSGNAIDTESTGNGLGAANIGPESNWNCRHCTLEGGEGEGLRVGRYARVTVRSTGLGDSDISGSLSINAFEYSDIFMRRGTLAGSLRVVEKSKLFLSGVTQTSLTPDTSDIPNQIQTDSLLESSGGTTLLSTQVQSFSNADIRNSTLDDIDLEKFSRAVISSSTLVDISCSNGSEAICDFSPTTSSCTLCP